MNEMESSELKVSYENVEYTFKIKFIERHDKKMGWTMSGTQNLTIFCCFLIREVIALPQKHLIHSLINE